MQRVTANYISSHHHAHPDLSQCVVYNPGSGQWLALASAGHISSLSHDKANDLAQELHEQGIECYVVTNHDLAYMMNLA